MHPASLLGVVLGTTGCLASTLPLTLLYQNTLNWTQNSLSHHGLLLSSTPLTLSEAEAECSSLSENLAEITAATQADFQQLLTYQIYSGTLDKSQLLWVSQSKGSKSNRCAAIKASDVNTVVHQACSSKLPALCSNSAPYSDMTTSDLSEKWHVSVESDGRNFIGYRDFASFRVLGIPYANPPTRWEYSTLFSGSQKTINATVGGAPCAQAYSPTSSEDCLFLNVWSPYLPESASPSAKTKLKPVMFWIHGGAFTGGTGTDPTVDGGSLASRGDVVVVTINYRLSTLGFLALDDGVISGNYGIGDQITALEWVKQNIAAFGGDPSRITIFGQSAGAGSVRTLLASSKADGLFQGAIAQSNLDGSDYASTYSNYLTIPQEVDLAANSIISLTNCTNSDKAAVRACLKNVPATTLVTLSTVARYVVVDGKYITSNELSLTGKTKGVSKVPTIWGWMSDDGGPFIGYPTNTDTFSSFALSQGLVNSTFMSAIVSSGLFPVPNTGNATLDVYNVTTRLTTDLEFKCLDQATMVAGAAHNVFDGIWAYEFQTSYQTSGWDPNPPVCDAPKTASHPLGDVSLPFFHCHSGELYYVFGNLGYNNLPFRASSDLTFSQYTLDTWSAFARSFDPNPNEAWLKARGYTETLKTVKSERKWEKVTKSAKTPLRALTREKGVSIGWKDVKQCDFLGYPLDYYL